MTAKTRAVLKMQFQTGDIPTGADYVDLIDSTVNLAETTVQVFASEIRSPGMNTSAMTVSSLFATEIHVAEAAIITTLNTQLLSAQTMRAVNMNAIVLSGATVNVSAVSAQSLNASAVNASTLSAQAFNASNLILPTLSAQVVRASAVHHKNAHALVYFSDNNVSHNIVTASAYASLSGALSASPDGMVGFTQNGSTTLTYTGSVTAAMLMEFNSIIFLEGAATVASLHAVSLFKNSVRVPESISTATLDSIKFHRYSGSAIIQMKTNDALTLRIKGSASSNYSLLIGSLMISCHPVSFEF